MKTDWRDYDPALGFHLEQVVEEAEVDAYGHVNNAVYLAWLDACAWAHAEALGFGMAAALDEQRGLAVRAVQLDYLGPARLGDRVVVSTWIVANDGRCFGTRRFDVANMGCQILRGAIDYAMIDLKTLRPARMTKRYRELLIPVSAL